MSELLKCVEDATMKKALSEAIVKNSLQKNLANVPKGRPRKYNSDEEKKKAHYMATKRFEEKRKMEHRLENIKNTFITLPTKEQVQLISDLIVLVTFE